MDDFAKLQAILAGLPMHAVPKGTRSCGPWPQCTGQRPKPPGLDGDSCRERIQRRLDKVCPEFPEQEDILRRLEVVHATLDLTICADNTEEKLYVAARGTDLREGINPWTTPRDLTNDLQIFIGQSPARASQVAQEYRKVRKEYPKYRTYCSGHSLGGNVVQQLAQTMEAEEDFRFTRVDIFNTGASPLRRCVVDIMHTDFRVHRVAGDWVSQYYDVHKIAPSVVMTTLQPKEHLSDRPHNLGHFLPDPAGGHVALCSSASEPCLGVNAKAAGPSAIQRDLRSWWQSTFGAFSCLGARKQPPMVTLQQQARADALRPASPSQEQAVEQHGGEPPIATDGDAIAQEGVALCSAEKTDMKTFLEDSSSGVSTQATNSPLSVVEAKTVQTSTAVEEPGLLSNNVPMSTDVATPTAS
mmetsp:Transcript_38541/g.86669  ORF Transcript_38541/g.86669 Transcript_38541/m.86669 type:complete len:413 (-) Transcript_38541:56-1294(-)